MKNNSDSKQNSFIELLRYSGGKHGLYLSVIVICGIIIRLIYFSGLVFSDDSYYSQLSYILAKGSLDFNIPVYPIFKIRLLHLLLTAVSFKVFGYNEAASIIIPFIFSIAGIILTYKFVSVLSGEKRTGLIAAFLMCFFPTDVVFASVNFSDLQCVFMLNLGLYFIYKAHIQNKISYSVYGGLFIGLSIFVKEYFVYVIFVLAVFYIISFIRKHKPDRNLSIVFTVVAGILLAEALFYLFTRNDFFYVLHILKKNYEYCYYDFFPNNLIKNGVGGSNVFSQIFYQIFVINIKSLFFRRFYLFMPFIAFVISYVYLWKKQHVLLNVWFILLSVSLCILTTSFTQYSPLNLSRSWYGFIIFLPAVAIVSIRLADLKSKYLVVIFVLYFSAGIYAINLYQGFLNVNSVDAFKQYIKQESGLIYTDHHTKYGIDLVKGFDDSVAVFDGFNSLDSLKPGNLVIYNSEVVKELKLQKYSFPDFTGLNGNGFSRIRQYGFFDVYVRN